MSATESATDSTIPSCRVKRLGHADYEPVWRNMQTFTDKRDASTEDELWLCEHPPVFTLGMAASREHVLAPGAIPLIQIDRGGQVTYHGPGQLMVYPLIDVRRHPTGVRAFVMALESSVIDVLAEFDIQAHARRDAPGVYVDNVKVASIGLRIRRGASYHGMAVNIDMDLEPFTRINPCGMTGLAVTDFKRLGVDLSVDAAADRLLPKLAQHLGVTISL
ncbi:MAG: lipoyl(octanoyl) transferase LipB [Pseudomonadota bacterium]